MSDIEESFIGSCFTLPDKISLYPLSKDDFHDRDCGKIWEEILNGNTDPISISEILGKGFEATLTNCIEKAHTSAIDKHAQSIIEASRKRKSLMALSNAYTMVDNGSDIDFIMSKLIEQSHGHGETGFKPVQEIIIDVYNGLDTKHEHRFIPTGFKALDFVIGGIERKNLVVIAGRPGSGKTSLGMSICNEASNTHNVCVSSIEMDNESFGYRIMATKSGMDLRLLRTGMVKSKEAWDKAAGAVDVICKYKMFIDDNPKKSATQIAAQCRRHKAKHGLDLLMVDYIGLLSPDNSKTSRERQIAEASRTFKLLAKELDIGVMLLCQLNRDAEGVRPNKSHLRESGAMEQDADVILFPYRESETLAEIIIGKNRNGPCTSVGVLWEGKTASYRELP